MAPLQRTAVSTSADESTTQETEATNTGTSTLQKTLTDDDQGIEEPNLADVLCGRGGNINTHPGNENFRKLIERHKRVYLTARFKKDKRLITDSIIDEVRQRGGRFLIRDLKTNLWHQVKLDKARDKTSQALRENAPKIRDEIEKENQKVRDAMRLEEEAASAAAANAREREREREYYASPEKGHGRAGGVPSSEYSQQQQYTSNRQYPYHPPPPHYHHSTSSTPESNSYYRGPDGQDYYSTPDKQQHYHQQHQQQAWSNNTAISSGGNSYDYEKRPPYPEKRNSGGNPNQEKTPTYNDTRSFIETAMESFGCPTKLEDVYSRTQPFDAQGHQSHHQRYPRIESENPGTSAGQYSGQKRNYSSPQRDTNINMYQRRDDHDHWRYQSNNTSTSSSSHNRTSNSNYYNNNYNNTPVYHELPQEHSSSSLSSPFSQQRHAKRNKWVQESTVPQQRHQQHAPPPPPPLSSHPKPQQQLPPPSFAKAKPERASSSSSSVGLWNPFPWGNNNRDPSPLPPPTSPSGHDVLNDMYMEEGQEVQLIPRLESMTIDHHLQEQQRPNTSSSENHGNREGTELRTPPPNDDDILKTEPDDNSNGSGGWTVNGGGCDVFFPFNLFGNDNDNTSANSNANATTSDKRISPVPSIDMNASLGSLDVGTENNSTTDLNGASLVNVFSDGGNTTSTGEKTKSDASFNFGDSLLAGDMMSH